MKFPTEGCRTAYECGQEYYLRGGDANRIFEALEFCETPEERVFFLIGIIDEVQDMEAAVY